MNDAPRAETGYSDDRPRRLSAALCLAIVLAATWIVHRVTFGFETWTFEGRRQQMIAASTLQAPAVTLRFASGPTSTPTSAPTLWRDDAGSPAAYLVDFIYTRCPGVCRALGTEYQQMQ